MIKKGLVKLITISSIFSIIGFFLFSQFYTNSLIFSPQEDLNLSEASVPIIIDDTDPTRNWSFCVVNYDWCSGSGTWNDPYVIEGLYFENVENDSLIIRHSDAVFILSNCLLYNCQFGFYINNVSNGIIAYNSFIAEGVLSKWGWSRAIDLNFCNNITISNNFVIGEYKSRSIEVKFSVNISIIKNLGYDTSSSIGLYHTNYSKVISCNMDLWLSYCSYNQINNNSLSGDAINIESSISNDISLNSIFSLSGPGIFLREFCSNNTISRNNITTGAIGISVMEYSNSNNITENTITFENRERSTDVTDHGITIIKGLYNTIEANNISFYNFGISLTWSNYSIITHNILYQTRSCITQTQCSDNYVEENTCTEPPLTLISGYPWFLLGFIVVSSLIIAIIKLRKRLI
ncbi:MAG: NosD domain-containing protein [Candidatus Heimdallarchaeota archaeon]